MTSHTITSPARPRILVGCSSRQRARRRGESACTVSRVVSTWFGLASSCRRAQTLTVSPNTSASLSTTGPQVQPILIASLRLRVGASFAAAPCIRQAARSAASGSRNWHTMPSPSVLTTEPPPALTRFSSCTNRRLMSASARASPTDS